MRYKRKYTFKALKTLGPSKGNNYKFIYNFKIENFSVAE